MRWNRASLALGLACIGVLLTGLLLWSLGGAADRAGSAAVVELAATGQAEPARLDLEPLPMDAGRTSATPASTASRLEVPAAQRHEDGLRIVCSATGKGVPAFEVEFEHGGRMLRVSSDLEGRVRVPAGFRKAGAGVKKSSERWGYRNAGLSIGGEDPQRGDFFRPAGGLNGVTLKYWGASFLLVELPGLSLSHADPIYGDFGARHVLGPELLLVLEPRRASVDDSANAIADFDLRGRGRLWIARGSLERLRGSIQTERVRIVPEGRTRLELVLRDESSKPLRGGHMGRIVVTHARTGEVTEQFFGGERAIFPGLPPGGASVSGMAEGLTFVARGLELRPFETVRLELRGQVLSQTGVRLDLVLQVETDRAVEQEQLPARVYLQPGLADSGDSTEEHESLAAPVEWSGAGSTWRGEAVFGNLPRGAYRLGLAAPSPWDEVGAFKLLGWDSLEDQLEPRTRGDDLWVQHDELILRECRLRVPRVMVLRFYGEAEHPFFEGAANRIGARLTGSTGSLSRVAAHHGQTGTFPVRRGAALLDSSLEGYGGRFLEELPRPETWDGGEFELDPFADPGENFLVTYRPLGMADESRPGFVGMDFAVELAPAPVLDRSVLFQGYLGE